MTKIKAPYNASNAVIKVTAELIEQSTSACSSHCMISEAIRVAYPDATYVSTDLASIRVTRNGSRYLYACPRSCQVALLDFDSGVLSPEDAFSAKLGRPMQIVKSGTRASHKAAANGDPKPKKARESKKVADGNYRVPIVVGGHMPPIGPLTDSNGRNIAIGRRRAYGLRAMSTRFPQYRAQEQAAQEQAAQEQDTQNEKN